MFHETSERAQPAPLPPVRTRWRSPEAPRTTSGRGLLGPVRSGLFRAFETPAPVAEPEHHDDAHVQEQPWLETHAIEDYETSEILLEVSLEDADVVLEAGSDAPDAWIEAAAEIETTSADTWAQAAALEYAAGEQGAVPGLQPLGEMMTPEAETTANHAAPISAWDLGIRPEPPDAEDAHWSRVREEWESLGQALVESLGMATEQTPEAGWPGFAPEEEASLDIADSELHAETESLLPGQDEVEGLEPVGAGFERQETVTPAPEAPVVAHNRALDELARRLEAFAASLRTEGRYAITRAQLAGDPMESMLAGFAAGWLAARSE